MTPTHQLANMSYDKKVRNLAIEGMVTGFVNRQALIDSRDMAP